MHNLNRQTGTRRMTIKESGYVKVWRIIWHMKVEENPFILFDQMMLHVSERQWEILKQSKLIWADIIPLKFWKQWFMNPVTQIKWICLIKGQKRKAAK